MAKLLIQNLLFPEITIIPVPLRFNIIVCYFPFFAENSKKKVVKKQCKTKTSVSKVIVTVFLTDNQTIIVL